MDGVIVDSEFYWKKKEDEFYKDLIPNWSDDDQKKILGQSVKNIYKCFVDEYGITMSWEDFSKKYDQRAVAIYKNETSLIEGIEDLFISLLALQKKIALASASRESWITLVLERFAIGKYFNEVVSSDFVQGEGKPNPAIYNYTAKKLGLENKDCLVIEDSRNGVLAAKVARMQCIGFKNGFNDNQDLSDADVIVDSFIEVSDILNK